MILSVRTLTIEPIWYAIWSPHHAPTAANTMTRMRLGPPPDVAAAARAITADSEGIGGKKPSTIANAVRAGYTQGEPPRARIHCSIEFARFPNDANTPHPSSR